MKDRWVNGEKWLRSIMILIMNMMGIMIVMDNVS